MADNPDGVLPKPEDAGSCIILCTAPDDACAHAIAQRLLAGNLAACVTLLPGAISLYYWQGMLEQQAEVQLLIKSRITLRQAIFAQIKAHHPYQTPELLVLPVVSGDPDYLSWLNNSLS
ncbi:cation tolerance protein CutA [Sodalis-like endosymbiont of Proechinophthirus fluctus]|uniref:divalent cation tolerance protein CutA n=1 Tax=Sodalis-like endosymbiont of Proechinophthirus fluctus TaxID=1462730 RepID=UPI0007A8AC13|nr:divalent cation tolerance protein CutA [Sodalis-like endosymbiont of Proechinophthirus fluctus]KYP96342.1 cation tolerance protein CutA [Sodalis-like endosymbiont of Proechinophthirus fluctus]